MARDWADWHRQYDDPDSELSQRLDVVVSAVRAVLDQSPPGPVRVLSLCAGQARDLCRAADGHARAADLVGVAVELSGGLAAIAAEELQRAGTRVEVRVADAGRPVFWSDVTPVDLLLLVGIFGNVTDGDIARTVAAVPAMVRPGGVVVWSRHRREPDVVPQVHDWFRAAGCTPVGLTSGGPGSWAVGVERVEGTDTGGAPPASLPEVLFRFL